MEPTSFQAALQDPSLASNLLDEQVDDWNSHLSEAIDIVTPQCPLCPSASSAP